MKRIALMYLAREETAMLRAEGFKSRAPDTTKRNIVTIKYFAIYENMWFHRRRYGWFQEIVLSFYPPTMMIEYKNTFPIHSNQARPFFAEMSLAPPLKGDQLLPGRPEPLLQVNEQRRDPIADILSPLFLSSNVPVTLSLYFEIPGTKVSIYISESYTFTIHSDSIFCTATKVFKDLKAFSP